MIKIQEFRKLHANPAPLILGNVWNVQSAKVYESLGFKAIATSSSAIANSLGYEDGERISFEEYFHIIHRIVQSISIPLSVDLEAGYGKTTQEVVSNILRLSEIGVVGINIEDSMFIDGKRKIVEKELFYKKLKEVIAELKKRKIEMFINIRTDTYLLGQDDVLNETIARINLFEKLTIDGVFIPCLTNETDIKTIISETRLPINLMAMPELPNFEKLEKLGVKRISSGNFLNDFIYKNLEKTIQQIDANKNFSPIFI